MADLIRRHENGVYTVSGPAGSARYEPLLAKGSVQAADGNHLWEYLPARLGERASEALDDNDDELWRMIESWYRDRLETTRPLL
ncbi:hypothetical protein J2S43_004690 [Catenuloplanes nepalensis]|uniref:Uncharacterized protein n=1 Tax=Catenuloplanes nepalensis TaxID=587533 RepID=A0ABT9MXL1_9ACTN|nr:hypothetical protein [Catenuloplanes nepalensis]MDP9796178.1 hypothetical protein [Catenuloplanes nepalensis]